MMTETSVTVIPDNNAGARQVPTVKTDPGQPGAFAGLTLNIAYYKTIPGILKLVQVVRIDLFSLKSKIVMIYDLGLTTSHNSFDSFRFL